MDVSENSGTPKSSILIEFSIINHPFWGTPVLGCGVAQPASSEAIDSRNPECVKLMLQVGRSVGRPAVAVWHLLGFSQA